MTTQNKLKNFGESFFDAVNYDSIENNGDNFIFSLKEGANQAMFENSIKEIFNITPLINKYEINLRSTKLSQVIIFENIQDFISGYSQYKENFDSNNILILNYKHLFIIKYENEQFTKKKALIFNFYNFRKLITFLAENPIFTTLNNTSDYKLIILSKDRGPYTIGYLPSESKFEDLGDLSIPINNLKNLFTKKEFIQFFKETIVNSGIHSYPESERMYEIIKHLIPYINLSEKDYENYIHDFSFEKLKAKFKEERNKYFENLDKNIESVNKQVASFPLTFAATAFASYQVKDKPLILLCIAFAYFLYTIIAFIILQMSSYNIDCLKQDLEKEENEIKNNFIKTYSDFTVDFEKIRKKIRNGLVLIWSLRVVLVLLFSIFALYCINQIDTTKKGTTINIPIENIKAIVLDTVKSEQTLTPLTDNPKDSVIPKYDNKTLPANANPNVKPPLPHGPDRSNVFPNRRAADKAEGGKTAR